MSVPEGAAGSFVRVASESDVPPNSLLSVEVGDIRVCLAHADGRIYAFKDNCTHRDFPLSAGTIEDGEIECTWHGAKFDMASGRATRLPAIKPVQTFEVRVENGEILIAVED
ncbi:MAG TPA: non-heme iron oxygenase ferredoxin subunit [Longimicrobiales bacterium]